MLETAKPTKTLGANARPYSFAAAVGALNVGECASRAIPINPRLTIGEMAGRIVPIKQIARDNVAGAVRQAKELTGGQYSVEVSEMLTDAANVYVVVIITRTE